MSRISELITINIKAFDRCSEAFRKAGESVNKFCLKIAENKYLMEIGKLPGSTKTKRLRKKRKTMVLKWFRGHMDRNARAC